MRMATRTPYTSRKEFEKELPPFDPTRTDYTERELELYTNAMLREDLAARPDAPKIVFQEHIEPKWRREVLAKSGTVDDEITKSLSRDGQMMYNRQHPQGRKVNSKEQRDRNGASYYR